MSRTSPHHNLRAVLRTALILALASLPFVAVADSGSSGPSAAASGKFDAALRKWRGDRSQGRGPERQRVIVSVARGQRGAVIGALRAAGYGIKAEHPLVNAITLELPMPALEALARRHDVQTLSIDAVTSSFQFSGGSTTTTTNTLGSTLGALSTNTSGLGVGVAVIDSGVSPSNVFGTRLGAFYDFTSGSARATAPTDPYGHGTHVAGLIAGSGAPNGGQYAGIAPSAKIIGLRVLDSAGRGYTSHVISAVEFAVANKSSLGIDIINLSLGHPIFESAATDPLVRAVEAAVRAGIVVVASAGNYGTDASGNIGYTGITSPGSAPSAISVGAVDIKNTTSRSDDTVASYSSRGPTWYDGYMKPDLVAPGHSLVAVSTATSTLYANLSTARVSVTNDTNKYLRLSGTSMAAAVTSGVVAQMFSATREGTWWTTRRIPPNGVKAILQYSAIRMKSGTVYLNALTQGAGSINAHGAVEFARRVDASRGIGSYWLTSGVTTSSVIGGTTLTWAQHLVWGTHLVWGNSIYYWETGWSEPYVWGAGAGTYFSYETIDTVDQVWDNHLVWGNHIVWGNALVGSVDGTHIVWGTAGSRDHIVWGNLSTTGVSGNVNTK
jgi:serine protease AprX